MDVDNERICVQYSNIEEKGENTKSSPVPETSSQTTETSSQTTETSPLLETSAQTSVTTMTTMTTNGDESTTIQTTREENKELCFTPYKGRTYAHLSDSKNCFHSGKFDFSKMKSVSFNREEVLELRRLLPEFERYDALFRAEESPLTEVQSPQYEAVTPPHTQPHTQAKQLVFTTPASTSAITSETEEQLFNGVGEDEIFFAVPIQGGLTNI